MIYFFHSVGILLFAISTAVAQPDRLIPFQIKDQFDRKYTEQHFLGKVVVLVGSDRDGSPFNEIWAVAIRDSLKDHEYFDKLFFAGLSDLRGVPFFLKGFVRGKFPKEKQRWVLMDWKGKIPQAYGFRKQASNVLVFDAEGKLVHRTSGREPEQAKLDAILAVLRKILTE